MLNFSQFAIFFLFLGYVLISVLFLFLFCFVLRSLAVQIKATTIPDSVLNCNFGRKQSEPALVSDLSLSVLTPILFPLKSLRNTSKGIHVGRSDGNMIARREAFRLDVKRSQCQALSHVRPSRRFRLGLGFTAGLIWGGWFTTPEEFEHGGFTLGMHQVFSVHDTPEGSKKGTINGHFGLRPKSSSVQAIQITCYVFKKFSVYKKTRSRRV